MRSNSNIAWCRSLITRTALPVVVVIYKHPGKSAIADAA
jgi:endonuclease V-like protein UPF0215 family